MSIVLPSLIGANKPASGDGFNQNSVSLDGSDDAVLLGNSSTTLFGLNRMSQLTTKNCGLPTTEVVGLCI